MLIIHLLGEELVDIFCLFLCSYGHQYQIVGVSKCLGFHEVLSTYLIRLLFDIDDHMNDTPLGYHRNKAFTRRSLVFLLSLTVCIVVDMQLTIAKIPNFFE